MPTRLTVHRWAYMVLKAEYPDFHIMRMRWQGSLQGRQQAPIHHYKFTKIIGNFLVLDQA